MPAGYQGYAGYGDPERAKVDRARQMAELLQQGATDTSPKSFWEGAAQLGKAFIARGAMDKADKAEGAYADNRKRMADTLISQMYPDAQGIAKQDMAAPAAFDLTPSAMEQRQAQGGVGDRVRSMAQLLGDPMAAIQMQQGLDTQKAEADLARAKLNQPTPYNLGDGAFAEYVPGRGLNMLREPTPEAPKPQDLPEGMWFGPDGKGAPQPIPGYVDMRTRIAQGSQSAGAGGDSYRAATPQDLATWGIPAGTPVKINVRTGEPEVISGAKPASDYTASQQSKFIQQAQTLDSVEGAIKAYTDLLEKNGPQLWTTGAGGDNATAKELDAARTAILIQAKELFNLGVLNGPDLDIISSAVPGVTGFDALGKSAESVKRQLGVLNDYITRGRNQIPAELLEKARPTQNQSPPPAQTAAPAPVAPRPVSASVPAGNTQGRFRQGVDPRVQAQQQAMARARQPPAAPTLSPDEQAELEALRAELGMQ